MCSVEGEEEGNKKIIKQRGAEKSLQKMHPKKLFAGNPLLEFILHCIIIRNKLVVYPSKKLPYDMKRVQYLYHFTLRIS